MIRLSNLAGDYTVARAGPDAPIPSRMLTQGGFLSLTRTGEELSVVAESDRLGRGWEKLERGWTIFRVAGPLDFGLTGIMARLAIPLAEAGISIFAVSTYDTDYVLVKHDNAPAAVEAWRGAGHEVAAG